ncbi:sensor histidine kinase [Planctomonas sp. JC2975]|uniref:histidine kinase n=1 Tax=Planctomonas sp. JC2975 TaxID=2729626 RepID=UPI00147550BA|nr:sensor histidine kinase [Planctomonas sp. JC2975]
MLPDPRWRKVLAIEPYVVLGLLVIATIIVERGQPDRLIPTLVLCAATAIWVLVMRTLPTPWRVHPAGIVVFMVGMLALNFALVLLSGWFGFLTIATFSFAYSLFEWPWELLAVGATAVVAGVAQASSFGNDPAGLVGRVGVIALNVVVMCGLSVGLRLGEKRLQEAATESERARLAREIHDTLAQRFAGIVTQLQAGEEATDDEGRRRHTDAALTLARDGLAEARRSVNALRPAALDAVRLPDALRNVARVWTARTGIQVDVSTHGDASGLRTDAEVALLRTAQEALANVERHASARRVVLTLRSDSNGSRLEVRDDGCGFDPGEGQRREMDPESGGYGLVAMQERIESVAGAFVVESRPGHGTAVRAQVPA